MKKYHCLHSAVLSGLVVLFATQALADSPWFYEEPQSQAVPEGGTAYLKAVMTGSLPITYAWRRNREPTNFYRATLYSTNCVVELPNMTPDKAGFFMLDVYNEEGYGPGKQVVIAVISSGMETNGFVLNIRGLTNSNWTIQCTTNCTNPEWVTLTNFDIPAVPPVFKFVDLEATNMNRFYKVVPKVY